MNSATSTPLLLVKEPDVEPEACRTCQASGCWARGWLAGCGFGVSGITDSAYLEYIASII